MVHISFQRKRHGHYGEHYEGEWIKWGGKKTIQKTLHVLSRVFAVQFVCFYMKIFIKKKKKKVCISYSESI